MSQGIFSSIVPTTTSGNQLAQILNDFKDAIVSGFSGTARPSELQAGGYWVDTTNNPTSWSVKLWTGVQDIVIFNLNLSTGSASFGGADNLFEISRISADSAGPILRLIKERVASLGQTLDGDTVGELQFLGTTNAGVNVAQARIRVLSTDDVTASEQGAILVVEAVSQDANVIQEVLRFRDRKLGVAGIANPEDSLHVRGNLRADTETDSTVGPRLNLRKKRVSAAGQVVSGDVLGRTRFLSTDDLGAEVEGAEIEVTAAQTHTTSAHGTRMSFKYKRLGQTTFKEEMFINDSGVNIDRLNVTNLVATTTELGTVVETQDAKLLVNKGGTQAMANAAPAGMEVEITDGTNAALAYDSTLASKWKVGNVGSLKEVITAGDTQTMTNKTLTSPTVNGPSITDPTRLDVKKDTEANLITYAATATNGQWCFATDTKVMYQVVDGELLPAGSGGGGVSLNWKAASNAPLEEFIDGLELRSFDEISSQEIFATLTVPQSYRQGKPISLKGLGYFCSATTGNVFFKAQSALIRNGSTVLGTYTNLRTSGNVETTVPGVANTLQAVGDLDITTTIGQINAVDVLPGDKIRIRLFRDNAAETSPAAAVARVLLDGVEPTFS